MNLSNEKNSLNAAQNLGWLRALDQELTVWTMWIWKLHSVTPNIALHLLIPIMKR